MRANPLVVAGPFAALCLWATLGVGVARADDPAAESRRLAELHLQLKTQSQSLGKIVEGFQANPVPKDLPERLSKLLKALPPELDDYRGLRAKLKVPDAGGLADKIQDGIKKAEALQSAYWNGRAAGVPAAPAAEPSARFPEDLKNLRGQLGELLGDSERRLPVLTAQTSLDALPEAARRAAAPAPAAGMRTGSSLLSCVNSFDGKGCGGGDSSRASAGAPRGGGVPEASAAVLPGARAPAAASAAPARKGVPPAAASPAGAKSPVGAGAIVSGGKVHLDRSAVPAPGAARAAASPGAAGGKVNGAAPDAAAAPVAAPLSPESQACVDVVRGPDPADPHHSSLADMCKTSPNLAPVLAGLLDSVKEQFGTVSGIVSNIVFLILGLLMSVATGGVGLILKLLALIGAGWALWHLVSGFIAAWKAKNRAAEGTADHAAALKQMGMMGGSLLIMITMALVGYGAGKTKPGAAAVKSMEGGLTAAMDKLGLTSMMEGLNSRIPAPVLATLEKFLGKAPERAKAAGEEKPVAPGEEKPVVAEEPLAAVEPAVAGVVRASGLTGKVAAMIKGPVREEVAAQMRTIIKGSLGDSTGKITGAQFNNMLRSLIEYARESKYAAAEGAGETRGMGFVAKFLEAVRGSKSGEGVQVKPGFGFKGVYPKGLMKLKYQGFGLVADEGAEVSGAELHELAHLFHTIQMRATLIRSGVPEAAAGKFIALMEDGNNYSNLEYFATEIGKPVGGGTGAGRFQDLAGRLIDTTESGMKIGEVPLPRGVTFEKGYAYWATRVIPRIMGKSVVEASARMGFYTFLAYYAVNLDINRFSAIYQFDQKQLDAMGVPKGKTGLRDVLNAAILHAPESVVKSLR